jgi:hypothetical protein
MTGELPAFVAGIGDDGTDIGEQWAQAAIAATIQRRLHDDKIQTHQSFQRRRFTEVTNWE